MKVKNTIWVLMLSISSCYIHKINKNPKPPVQIPKNFMSIKTGTPLKTMWWNEFNDKDLKTIIEIGLKTNFDIKAGIQRLKQAVAIAKKAGAPLFPTISLEGNASKTKQIFMGGKPFGNMSFTNNQFSLSVISSYELDIWRKVSSLKNASLEDIKATEFDIEALKLTIAAQIATTYFNLKEAISQKELILSQIKTSKKLLDLLKLRFAKGLATALDVYEQAEQLAALEALLPPVEENIELLKNEISVLCGYPPGKLDLKNIKKDLPNLPQFPDSGVPSQLLLNRPDLKAEKSRLLAIDWRIGAQLAEFLPTIRLSAKGGTQSNKLSTLFDDLIWSIASSITAPIFQGGRIRADLEYKKAQYAEKLENFAKKFINAVKEVENAILQERQKNKYIKRIEKKLLASKNTLEEAKRRYFTGLTDFIPVLRALSTFQSTQRELIKAKKDLITTRIKLYQALGNPWKRNKKLIAKGYKNEEGS